ncbi:MAG: hypothetical protein BroJett031_34630 [Betaproteobacteria bacterium]|nr:MAG: hypothetical protein BroJett031_34630 [Betaproteobacteria bacterium]
MSLAAPHVTRIDTDDIAVAETFAGALGAAVSGTDGGGEGGGVAAGVAAGASPPPQEASANAPRIAQTATADRRRWGLLRMTGIILPGGERTFTSRRSIEQMSSV